MSDYIQTVHGRVLAFDEKNHAYTWDGAFVPGVTTILKVINKGPRLEGWLKNQVRDYWREAIKSGRTDLDQIHKDSWSANEKTLKEAADIGTNVHAYAECHFKKLALPELHTDQAKRGVEAFHKWLD